MNLPQNLALLFTEWEEASQDSLDALSSFLAQHSELSDEELQTLIQVILPKLYGTWYRSGNKMSVNRFLSLLLQRDEAFWEETDFASLTENCLVVLIQNSEQKQDLEDLCLTYPEAEEFLREFWKQNPDFFEEIQTNPGNVQNPTEEPGRVYNDGEAVSISENYNIQDYIGRGAEKEVHEVTQRSTGQKLALKVSYNGEPEKSGLVEEAKIQALLSHQGIPAVYSLAFGAQTPPVLVERYIEGENWSDIFGKLSLEENLGILEKISLILASVHREHQVIHGDLKPLNVKVNTKYNEVYLVDWGMAMRLDHKPSNWTARGTTAYLPPEIARENVQALCPATDVFMLGAILYQILCGKAPYEEFGNIANPFAAWERVQNGDWDSLPETGPYGIIPQELASIVSKAMALTPSDRYKDAGEFADALEKYRLRARLIERFAKAKAEEEELHHQNGKAVLDHHTQAMLLAGLIGNGNEFSLIRRDLAEIEKENASNSDFLRDVFSEELAARQFLLEKTIELKDYAQATAQLETGRRNLADFRDLYEGQTEETSFIQEKEVNLLKAERDLHAGLAARNRERFLKMVTLCSVFCVLLLVCFGIYQQKRHAQKIAEERKTHANYVTNELNRQIYQLAEVADYQHFGQGKLAVTSALYEIEGAIPVAWRKECALRSSMMPKQLASCSELIQTVAFSPNEDCVLARTKNDCFFCWTADGSQQLSQETLTIPIPGLSQSRIFPNPCFTDPEAKNTMHSAEFLIFTPNGYVIFWKRSGGENDAVFWDLAGVNNELFPEDDSAVFSWPVFFRQGTLQRMAACGEEGQIYIFSFPDGKLLKQIQAHEKGVAFLTLSPDQKFLVSAGKDGKFCRWNVEGTLLEELPLPVPAGSVCGADISPDGKRLAVGTEGGEILVWDFSCKKVVAQAREGAQEDDSSSVIQKTGWLDDSRWFTLCANGHYRIWDLNRKNPEGVPEFTDIQTQDSLPLLGIRDAALSSSRQKLVLSEENGFFSLIGMKTGKKEWTSEGYTHCDAEVCPFLASPVYHPGIERILVAGTGYRPLVAYQPGTMAMDFQAALPVLKSRWCATGVVPARKGTRFAVALTELKDENGKGLLQVYEGNPPALKYEKEMEDSFSIKNQALLLCSLSPDGNLLAETTSSRGVVRVRDCASGEVLKTFATEEQVLAMFFSEDGNKLFTFTLPFPGDISGATKAKLIAWDGPWSGTDAPEKFGIDMPYTLKEDGMVSAWNLSRNYLYLAIGFKNGKVRVMNPMAMKDYSMYRTRDYSDPLLTVPDSIANGLRQKERIRDFSNVIGLDWSEKDDLLAISHASGKTVLIETGNLTEISTGYCGEGVRELGNARVIHPVFSGRTQFYTFDACGGIYAWDWDLSPEKPKILADHAGVKKVLALENDRFAGVGASETSPFVVFRKNQEEFQVGLVEDFVLLRGLKGDENFLILKKDGSLEARDSRGEPVDLPVLSAEGFPKDAFRLALSPDSRWLAVMAAKTGENLTRVNADKKVWCVDLREVKPVWKPITIKEEGKPVALQAMRFSSDSQELLFLGEQTNDSLVWNLEKGKLIKYSGIVGEQLNRNPAEIAGLMTSTNLVTSKSGKFVFLTGVCNELAVWEKKTENVVQWIHVNSLTNDLSAGLTVLPLDRGFGKWEAEDAFVVCCPDGMLRFYQFVPAERAFRNVYIVNRFQLEDLISMDGEDAGSGVIKSQRLCFRDLSLSPDGQKLYVGADRAVWAFRMEEIRDNVARLEEAWKENRVEKHTALRFDLNTGMTNINRVFFRPY